MTTITTSALTSPQTWLQRRMSLLAVMCRPLMEAQTPNLPESQCPKRLRVLPVRPTPIPLHQKL
jgi:hypothetical protein